MPLLFPALVAAAVLAATCAGPAASRLRASRGTAFVVIATFGLVLAVTLTPTMGSAPLAGRCDLSMLGVLSPGQLLLLTDRSLNVWLFVPLGIAVGVLPRSPLKAALLGLAVVLPVVIEGVQYLAIGLNRECEGRDVIDNLVGLGIGLVAAVLERHLGRVQALRG